MESAPSRWAIASAVEKTLSAASAGHWQRSSSSMATWGRQAEGGE